MKRILLPLCISLLGWQALAGEVDDNLKKLEAALKKNSGSPEQSGAFLGSMLDLRRSIANGDFEKALFILKPGSTMDLPDPAKKAADDLRTSIETDIQNRRQQQEAQGVAAVAPQQTAIKHAAEAVKKAKTAADLDAVLDELDVAGGPQEQRSQANAMVLAAYEKVDDARFFTATWQEYLAAKAGGYEDKAREIARNLADAQVRLLPRSELLARAYDAAKPEAKLAAPSQVIVNIDKDGKVRIGKAEPVALDEVKAAAARLKETNPNAAVIVRALKDVPFEQVAEVVDALKNAGLSNVALAVARPSAAPSPAPENKP